jgi:hypothetical protein
MIQLPTSGKMGAAEYTTEYTILQLKTVDKVKKNSFTCSSICMREIKNVRKYIKTDI